MLRSGPAALVTSVLACAAPPPAPPPAPRVDSFAARPDADAADPRAPVTVRFAVHACEACLGCDVDPASLARALAIDPPTSGPATVLLDPVRCEARVEAPWALATGYVLTLGTEVVDSRGTPLAEPASFAFRTAGWYPGEPLPRLVGSWPPAGDPRLGPLAPVVLLFDREPAPGVVTVRGPVPVSLEVMDGLWALRATPAERWPEGEVGLSVQAGPDPTGAVEIALTRPGGADERAPEFAGAAAPEAVDGGVRVRWEPAADDASGPEAIRYLVHVGAGGAGPDLRLPSFVTEPGAGELVLGGAGPWRVVVRAQDEAGNVDGNAVVREGP